MQEWITVRGARENNLKNISVKIPRNKITVITGLSGSGKSTLAFDTIYAEGQRRYLESLSSYARQFLEKLKKPEVDYIGGLSPSVAIDQKSGAHHPRSTVATTTEIFDFLRLLFAKAGASEDVDENTGIALEDLADRLEERFLDKPLTVLAPVVRGRKGEHNQVFQALVKKGFDYVRIDGKPEWIKPDTKLKKTFRHDIEVIVDQLTVRSTERLRLEKAVQTAAELAEGEIAVWDGKKTGPDSIERFLLARAEDGAGFKSRLTPNLFSFNSPYGACTSCRGLGKLSTISEKKIILHPEKPLLRGALNEDIFFSFNKYFIEDLVYDLSKKYDFEIKAPFRDWPEPAREALLLGDGNLSGLTEEWERLLHETESENIRSKIRQFMKTDVCPDCKGKRLKKESLAVKIAGKNIIEMTELPVETALAYFDSLRLPEKMRSITDPVMKEIRLRIRFLNDVGLGYLSLDRTVNTLSGGELQRIRLAAQLGLGLTGVMYVLDEPSIGLHPRDHEKLLKSLENLRDQGNTILIVEHDEETMLRADYFIDLGPGAGVHGGEILCAGPIQQLLSASAPSAQPANQHSVTLDYLAGRKKIIIDKPRLDFKKAPKLVLRGCAEHNLKKVDAVFPLGLFTCVTGVSGSGKSTLVHDTLYKALHNRIWKTDYAVGVHKKMEGAEKIERIIEIDQSPIGRTPRSTPATYTDMFGFIRQMYGHVELARLRNYKPSHFSFNLKGGRCEICRGEGLMKLEMSFMPDVYVTCESCQGKRYTDSLLEVRYQGKNIAEVLDMPVSEAAVFFNSISTIRDKLVLLERLGLGYIKLGQPSTTLSGGEAQRIKIATELSKKAFGPTIYILDEPTTGLHFEDVSKLLQALFELRDQGHTVIVIEHHSDVIRNADYVIDLGPEGGKEGGSILFQGAPADLARFKGSYTGRFLR
ncbi:MAG TPA: excinuclease ABC subunit UvrA [Candidatus Omnitrophota bacterium]|nr:excinuclease ABC subunit UvrA [Candidatus Omnitrophota bacterium]